MDRSLRPRRHDDFSYSSVAPPGREVLFISAITAAAPEPILRVEDVHYTYFRESRKSIEALRGTRFSVQRGEYLAIIGHNGSGKSTLAKHLNGLLLPTQGNVFVKDWNTKDTAHRVDVRSTVGIVFQTPDNQIVATIVEEDVAFGPENLGVPRPELQARVDWALDTVGMTECRQRAPHLLSGGQKQRVALAGILAMKPEVLVLDESTALLDPLGRSQVLDVVRRLREQGVTIIAVTHFMAEAALADRLIVLHQGEIALEGTPAEVFSQRDRLRELQLDVPDIAELSHRLQVRDARLPGHALSTVGLVDGIQQALKNRQASAARQSLPQPPIYPLGASPDSPNASSAELVVDIQHLEHTYLRGTPLESTALRGADLQVRRGEVVGIIGHTGSGKSTLIQHLNGLMRPQRGSVRVLDYDTSRPNVDLRSLRRRVGLVFQFPEAQLFEPYIGDDVAFGPWQMGYRGEELRERVRDAMNAVGLPFEAFKDRAYYSLSGGEKRRAALAGVLACKPEILVLDEPTAGLDPHGHKDLLERLMKIRREWGTVLIIVSHNMEDIARLCDRVYVLAKGQSVLNGAPREIFGQPERLIDLGLGLPAVTEAMHALRRAGLPVQVDALTVEEAEHEIMRAWTSAHVSVPARADV